MRVIRAMVIALLLTSVVSADSPLLLTLKDMKKSHAVGLVSLNATEPRGGTSVVVAFDSPDADKQYAAHFYSGTCAAPGEKTFKLNNVVNGRSDTILKALDFHEFINANGEAWHGPYAIIVSETKNPTTAVACADLKGYR